MNKAKYSALKEIALSCLNFLIALANKRNSCIRLEQQDGFPVFSAPAASLDLLAAIASEMAWKYQKETIFDYGREPLLEQSYSKVLSSCANFASVARQQFKDESQHLDWSSMGIRAQTFSSILNDKRASKKLVGRLDSSNYSCTFATT
jgi:hypothetical protein